MSDETMTTNSQNPTKNVSREVVEAINLMAQGKRNMMCGEIAHAVSQLQEACRKLDKEYGDGSDECADAYFWYGKALLEMSRLEGGVLGDAVPGGDSEASSQSSKDDDDDEDEEDDAAADGNSTVNEGTEEGDEDGAVSEDIENEETDETDAGKPSSTETATSVAAAVVEEQSSDTPQCTSSAAVVSAVPGTSAEGGKQEDNEPADDISNLQLAWEMLECAKVIYMKHDSKEMKIKLSDTYSKLGEVGMETEQYDQAISDLATCLEIQQQLLSPDDRRLAETRYQLGLACTFDKRYSDAISHYRSAIGVIKTKIAHLSRVASGEIPPDAGVDTDGFDTPQQLAQKEIEELASILPDIEAKIEDVEDESRNADQVSRLMRESVAPTGSSTSTNSFSVTSSSSEQCSSAFSSAPAPAAFQSALTSSSDALSSQPVNNISHLVRKKRKPEEEALDDASKKQKTAAATSSVDSVGSSDGIKSSVEQNSTETISKTNVEAVSSTE